MADLSNAACLLCGDGRLSSLEKKPRDCKDADIVVCKLCRHIQVWPLMSEEEENIVFDSDANVRFGALSAGSDFGAMRRKFSELTKEHVNNYFTELQNYNNVLELGAGYGFFMEALNQKPNRVFNIEGIEISKYKLDNFVGGIVHNVNILTDEIPGALVNKHDCIICIFVLEHIRSPILFLKKIKPLLKSGDSVIFEVPNINCFLGEISEKYKDFMYVYEHCSYFSAATLKLVFEEAGYTIDEIKTYEIYSIENHCRWVREGTPFTKYNQMFMPDERLEWINEIYKENISRQGKGYSLSIKACI